jgi:hypothetical protein
MDPYRHMERREVKKLPRIRARLRGLYRRILLPAKVLGVLAALGGVANVVIFYDVQDNLDTKRAEQDKRYHDWEGKIANSQHELDQKVADFNKSLEPQQRDLAAEKRECDNLKGELEMKLREADYHKELQVPMLVRGVLSAGSNDFHGAYVATPSEPVTCYIDRGENNRPQVNCIKVKN